MENFKAKGPRGARGPHYGQHCGGIRVQFSINYCQWRRVNFLFGGLNPPIIIFGLGLILFGGKGLTPIFTEFSLLFGSAQFYWGGGA